MTSVAMKRSLREKFKQNVDFVKPLYRKVKFGNRVQPVKKFFVSIDVKDGKPGGHGVYVKRKIITDKSVDCCNVIDLNSINGDYTVLPGACEINNENKYSRIKTLKNSRNFNRSSDRNAGVTTFKLSKLDCGKMANHGNLNQNSKYFQAKNSVLLIEKVPVTWLRVYPAPQTRDEGAFSVIFRCLVCQLGLAAFLIMWTLMWVFIIHYFEEPYEREISLDFEKNQNQLVIDLATELRQITPLSPKWKYAIEKRIEDERLMTIQAVARGAKIHPGQFWDLSGTFLFTIYVMTALGFGAPVPHTTWGRTSALVYAALAVPVHIFLMVHASTCVVTNMEACIRSCKDKLYNKKISHKERDAVDNKESPNYSRYSEGMKSTSKASCLRRKLAHILSIFYVGRCIPAATVIYYASGVVAFGVLRGRTPLDSVMFPLEFTTTGGLEQVEFPVRILYGLYVEGAMSLLACALAAFRAHSSASVNYVADKYRLFVVRQPS